MISFTDIFLPITVLVPMALALLICAPAWAATVKVSGECEIEGAPARMRAALMGRLVEPEDAELVFAPSWQACIVDLKVDGASVSLGVVNNDPESYEAAAALAVWHMQPGSTLRRDAAVVQARSGFGDGLDAAQGLAAAFSMARLGRARALKQAEVELYWQTVDVAQSNEEPDDPEPTMGPRRPMFQLVPELGAASYTTWVNGGPALLAGPVLHLFRVWEVSVGAVYQFSTTYIPSAYEYVVVTDNLAYVDSVGIMFHTIEGELQWVHPLRLRPFDFMTRVRIGGAVSSPYSGFVYPTEGNHLALDGAYCMGLELGFRYNVRGAVVEVGAGYRYVSALANIGPQPYAMTGPTLGVRLLWSRK